MPPMTGTGDISYRTAGFVCAELLKRAQPLLAVSRLGQNKPIPKNSGDTIKFRGYEALDTSPKVLIEGVTPTASKPTFRDVVAKLEQYGDYIEITDKLSDTIEDPVWGEFTDILGEQSGIMLERVVINKLLAGTNVFFSGSTGGVASGPMTATFLLPFAQGACEALGGNVVTDAFGVVAMVAMTPLLTIQMLGLLYQLKMKRAAQETPPAPVDEEIIEL